MEVGVSVTVELPNVNSIVFGCRNHHSVVNGIKHSADKRVSVPNESLEIEGDGLLGIVVPELE